MDAPGSDPLSWLSLQALRRGYESGLVLLFLIALVRAARARGLGPTARELAFGFAVSQSVELLAVMNGRYRYPDWAIYFPPRPAWVPLGVGLGWAALLATVMRVSEILLGRGAARWQLAGVDALLAVAMDLVLDPIVSGPPLRMWVWHGPGLVRYRLWLLDVPVFNFVGWLVLVFCCSLELRLLERRARPLGWMLACLAADLAIAEALMLLPW